MKQENGNMSVTQEKEQEGISIGILGEIKRQGRIGLMSTIAVALIVGALCAYQMAINYRNSREWRELFSSYDYVTQDGNGQNYYNSEIGGNVNNGSESEETVR